MKPLRKRDAKADPSVERLIRIFQSEGHEVRERQVPLHARLSLHILALMFLSFITMSWLVKIDRVVTSSRGQMVTVEPNIVIQPLDPSIVKSINVHEGDQVKRDALLALLDPTLATADVLALRSQLASYQAEIARCEAELAGAPFGYTSLPQQDGVDYAALQRSLYDQRKSQFDSQIKNYDEQIALSRTTIAKLADDKAKSIERLVIASQVEKMYVSLEAKDLGSTLQTLTAKDSAIQMKKAIEFDQNSIEETQHQVEATAAAEKAFVDQWHAQTSEELVQSRNQYETIKQSLEKALKHQELNRIKAPDDAIVLHIEKRSVGSVLQPGETFMELALLKVPVEAEILVDPLQVGFIRPGDPTVIKLDPYDFVEHGTVDGQLRWVSQGTFTMTPTGSTGVAGSQLGTAGPDSATIPNSSGSAPPYYMARVAITKVNLHDVPADFQLLPGTTLAADIHVGTRSLFWYLVRGLVRGFKEAMREP